MKQRKKLTRIEKGKFSKLLNKNLRCKSNQEILECINDYEEKRLESFKKNFKAKGNFR